MALVSIYGSALSEHEPIRFDSSIDSSLVIDQEKLKPREKDFGTVEPVDKLTPTYGELKIEKSFDKLRATEFPVDRPWLPQQALKILNKLTKGPIAEKELMRLMDLIADRAIAHFRLEEGKFVALTLLGRVVEVSETRTGLLKKIQGCSFSEQIFVWRVGFQSFSGRT